jgi:LysM repeat protein
MMRRAVFAVFIVVVVLPLAVGPRAALAGGYTTHVVKPGETLYSIARYYGVDPMAIANANGIVNPNMIYAGQPLTIPGGSDMPVYGYEPVQTWDTPVQGYGAKGGCTHVVAPGETLYGIASAYGVSVGAIMQANGLGNPDVIFAGQTLAIPGCGGMPYPSGPVYSDYPMGHPHQGCGGYYTVKPGDSLSEIAMYHGTTANDIAAANNLKYPYIIYSGQSLFIPCGGSGYYPVDHHYGHPKKGHHQPPPPPKQETLHPAACPREVQIVQPKENETVPDVVHVIGTADIPDFQFYKVEYAQGRTPLDSSFNSIGQTVPTNVVDSILATWYVGNMPAGDYTLRLTAVDNEGQFPRPCDVHIKIN